MHIHNAIQTNYAYKGIRGGSWRNSGIRDNDYPWQATRSRQVFTTGSQWEGKVSIVHMEAAICILFHYSDARLNKHAFLPSSSPFPPRVRRKILYIHIKTHFYNICYLVTIFIAFNLDQYIISYFPEKIKSKASRRFNSYQQIDYYMLDWLLYDVLRQNFNN